MELRAASSVPQKQSLELQLLFSYGFTSVVVKPESLNSANCTVQQQQQHAKLDLTVMFAIVHFYSPVPSYYFRVYYMKIR